MVKNSVAVLAIQGRDCLAQVTFSRRIYSDCKNFFPLQDMGPAEKQHLPDLLNFCQTYSLHAIGLPVSQLVALLNSVSSRIILHNK